MQWSCQLYDLTTKDCGGGGSCLSNVILMLWAQSEGMISLSPTWTDSILTLCESQVGVITTSLVYPHSTGVCFHTRMCECQPHWAMLQQQQNDVSCWILCKSMCHQYTYVHVHIYMYVCWNHGELQYHIALDWSGWIQMDLLHSQ